jgi:hypothetical protein
MANAASLNTEAYLPCWRICQRALGKAKNTWARNFNSFVFSAHIFSKFILALRQLNGGHLSFCPRAKENSRNFARLAFSETNRQSVYFFDLGLDGGFHKMCLFSTVQSPHGEPFRYWSDEPMFEMRKD